jgi:phenylalanyl-tRNA synthetase beta chain
MLGYDRVGSEVRSAGQVGGGSAGAVFRRRLRDALVRAGLREVWLLSFVSDADLALMGDAPADAIAIANPLQADEAFLRTRLLPGMLHATARNQARGSEAVAVFETGTVFGVGDPVEERQSVAFVLAGSADEGWAVEDRRLDVLDAKGVLEALMVELGVGSWSLGDALDGPFHPGRSASILVGGRPAGRIGELLPRVAGSLDLTGRVACVELDVDSLMDSGEETLVLADVPRFPPVRRDLAFVVDEDVPAGRVRDLLEDAAGDLLAKCVLFDVFRGDPLPDGSKSLAFALEFRSPDRTLTGEETDPFVEAITRRLSEEIGAELRSG